MMVKTRKKKQEMAQENIKSRTAWKTETCQYLGITINKERNLEKYIKVIARKSDTIIRETEAIGAKNQVGKDEIRVLLELFDTCLMTAALIMEWKHREIKLSQIACTVMTMHITCMQTALHAHKNLCTVLIENTIENYLSPAHTDHYTLKSDSHIPENFYQIRIFPSHVPKNTIICLFGV